MRKYQRIWEAIKRDRTVSIAAEPSLHTRIINGVRKEKCRDLCYKLILSNQNKRHEIVEKTDGKLITFYIVEYTLLNIQTI